MVAQWLPRLLTLVLLLDAKAPTSTEPLHFAADRPIDIKHIALDLWVDIPARHVEGTATIDLVALREVSSVRFDAVDFVESAVTLARDTRPLVPADYRNGGESIEVFFRDKPLTAGSGAKIVITYSITDPKSGLHFFGPSEAEPDVPFAVWSHGETTDNRYWVPCFDHPNEMQTTEMKVTVASGNEAVSNGRLLSKVDNADKTTTFHWLQDKPHVSYLMTLVVGEFYTEQDTWRGKPVTYYVPPKHKNDLRRSFGNTVKMLELFSNLTGVEYPWDKYAHQAVETSDLRQAFEAETGRSLERFFFDWTERPGAPSVNVSYDWVEDDKLAKVVVKQTQESEAFHFPLEVEFHFDEGLPAMLHGDVTEMEQRFYFPLPKRPKMVLIDPQQAVLMELKEQKGGDLWKEQLNSGPHALDRIRAAANLGESKNDKDTSLLGEALVAEKFWGVGEEIAQAIGKAGGDKARDVLLAGLGVEHPKIRRAVVEQLGLFHRDEKVMEALRAIIVKGDASYRVEAEAIESYAKLQPPDAVTFLPTLLDRPSHAEQIRSAALSGLGKQPDAVGLETLLEWTRRGKPRECRQAAMRALSELAKNVHLPDATLERIVSTLLESVKGEQRRVQQSVITALRELGHDARPALPVLQALAANDPDARIRKSAKEAAEKITAAAPEQVQVKELRDELAKLRDEGKELRKRLEKLEAKPDKNAVEEGE